MKINNVDVESIRKTVAALEEDPSKAKKVNTIEGVWNTEEGPQFSATVTYEGGTMTIEADQPRGLGGGGTRPGPMIYCLYGSASCYAATFATIAAMEGVKLESLKIKAESFMDLSRTFGLSENPVVDRVKYTIEVKSDAPADRIREIEELSRKRCPAVYCLTNPIPLETELVL